MKATKGTKNKAKKLGINVTLKRGKKRVPKSESVLKAQVNRKRKVKKLTKKEASVCGRNLGSRGGKATARKRK